MFLGNVLSQLFIAKCFPDPPLFPIIFILFPCYWISQEKFSRTQRQDFCSPLRAKLVHSTVSGHWIAMFPYNTFDPHDWYSNAQRKLCEISSFAARCYLVRFLAIWCLFFFFLFFSFKVIKSSMSSLWLQPSYICMPFVKWRVIGLIKEWAVNHKLKYWQERQISCL